METKASQLNPFVYSNNIQYRLLRHALYWLVWIAYFLFIYSQRWGPSYSSYAKFLEYTLFEMMILLSVDAGFCYAVIYLLVPKVLLKEKYFAFFFLLSFFLFLDISVSSYFYTWLINPLRRLYNLPELRYIAITDLLRGLNGVMMITGVSVSIRFYKMWNIKKHELDLAKPEKTRGELIAIDSYLQPVFLPVLLKKVYAYSFSPAAKIPEVLQKLENITSYLANECNRATVGLTKEMDIIKYLIQIEQTTNNGKYTIQFDQSGEYGELEIVPYILFPFVESSFRQINDKITDKHWINIKSEVTNSTILLRIKNSKPVETSNLLNYETATLLQMRKRLSLFYPGSHKLNTIIEENVFTMELHIDLSKAINLYTT